MKTRDVDLSPIDQIVLYQARELQRRKRAIRKVSIRLMATLFTSSQRRYMQLVSEASKIASKEAQRIYELDHPPKRKRKAKKS